MPEIVLDETKEGYVPTSEEHKFFIDTIISSDISLRGKHAVFKEGHKVHFIRLEPDRNYANGLIIEAKKSIENLFEFLESHYLKKPEINFVVPGKKEDIKMTNQPPVPLYLVADLSMITSAKYEFGFGNEKQVDYRERVGGLTPLYIEHTREGGKIIIKIKTHLPIFYNTSENFVPLIDTPATEALHKAVHPYTIKHFFDSLKVGTTSNISINDQFYEYLKLEEKFVHALSMLWLSKYNTAANLGLTQEELNKNFAMYETKDVYRGVNKLAKHIEQIGIQKAIELYATNPSELFKVLKK